MSYRKFFGRRGGGWVCPDCNDKAVTAAVAGGVRCEYCLGETSRPRKGLCPKCYHKRGRLFQHEALILDVTTGAVGRYDPPANVLPAKPTVVPNRKDSILRSERESRILEHQKRVESKQPTGTRR